MGAVKLRLGRILMRSDTASENIAVQLGGIGHIIFAKKARSSHDSVLYPSVTKFIATTKRYFFFKQKE